VARFLLLSPHRVRQLTAEGILEKVHDEKNGEPLRGRFNLLSTVNSYIRYLRSKLAGGADSTDEYTLARARRMSALASIEELRLKRIHGELHHGQDVEFLLTQMITACRQRLLALPSRCCHPLQAKTNPAEIAEILRVEIYDALKELSEYDPAKFEAANERIFGQHRSRKVGGCERAGTVKRAAKQHFSFFRARRRRGEVTNGGRRPGSGRRHRYTVRIGCSLLRPVYLELVRQEKLTGVYRCQIVGRIVTERLIGAAVNRELERGAGQQPPRERMAGKLGAVVCLRVAQRTKNH
jgi:hypothetical protein